MPQDEIAHFLAGATLMFCPLLRSFLMICSMLTAMKEIKLSTLRGADKVVMVIVEPDALMPM